MAVRSSDILGVDAVGLNLDALLGQLRSRTGALADSVAVGARPAAGFSEAVIS
jgi:hypothetical protein